MKRKKWLIAAATLLAVLAVAPVAAFWWIDGERLQSIATDYFERTGGVRMRADNVTRTIGLVPRIEVEGLTIDREEYDEPLLEVRRGAFSISLLSLVTRPIELSDIVVEDADIELPVDDDGLLYWGRAVGDLLSRLKNAGVRIDGFRASDVRIDGRHTGGRGQTSTTVASISGTMPEPAKLAFEIENMETAVDIAPPVAIAGEFELATLALDHAGEAPRTVRVEGHGRLADWPLDILLASGNPLAGDALSREPVAAEIELGESRAALEGTISRGADRHVDAEIVAEVRDLGAVPDGSVSLRLSDPGTAWLVDSLAARWGETAIDGRLRLERRQPRPYLSGRIGLRGLSLGSEAANSGESGEGAGEQPADRRPGGAVDAAPTADNADRDAGSGRDDGSRDAWTWPGRLDLLDADLTLDTGELRLYGIPVTNVRAEVALEDARLRVPATASALAGALDATLEVDAAGESAPVFRLSLDIDGLSTREVLGALDIDQRVEGKVDGRADLDAEGAGLGSLLESLHGRTRLTMSGGRLSETLAELADQDIAAALLGSIDGDEMTPIRCAIVDFDGDAGLFEARTLLIDTGEVKLVGDGEIDLADRRLDIVLQPHAKDFSLLSASAPVEISGPLTDPGFSTDIGEAIASILTPVEFGGAEDAACSELLAEVQAGR